MRPSNMPGPGAGLTRDTAEALARAGARPQDLDTVAAAARKHCVRLPSGSELRPGRPRAAAARWLVRLSARGWEVVERLQEARSRLEP
jgi:hypothetical protein